MAGTLKLLGVDLGPKLQPGNEGNVRGYFEHRDIVLLHDRLLNALGSHWADPLSPPAEELEAPELRGLRQEIEDVLRRDFTSSPLWAIKDPRMNRLLGLWQRVAADLHVDLAAIIMLRGPRQVAESLAARDGLPRDKSYLLWLDHLLMAERDTRRLPRVFVRFDDLLSDWRGVIARVSERLDLTWPLQVADAGANIDEFLDRKLNHHNKKQVRDAEADPLPVWVERIQQALEKGAEDDDTALKRTFAAVRREYASALELIEPRIKEARGEYEELFRKEAARRQKETADLLEHAANLEREISPLRAHAHNLELEIARYQVIKPALEQEAHDLRAHVENVVADLDRHREAEQDLETEAISLRAQVTVLEQELQQHRALRGELERQLGQHRATRPLLETDIDHLRANTQDLEEDLARHRALRAEMERELEQHRATRPLLEREIDHLRAHAHDLEEDLGRHRVLSQELQRNVDESRELRSALEAEVESLGDSKSLLEGELQEIKTTAARLERQIEASTRVRNQLQKNLEKARERLRKSKQALDHSITRAHGLEAQNEWLSTSLQSLEQERQALQGDLARMQASRSWRITRPVRAIGAAGRALRHHVASPRSASAPPPLTQAAPGLHFHIDQLRVQSDTFLAPRALRIAGWCLVEEATEPARLEIRSRERVLSEFGCSRARSDVLAAFPHLLETTALPRCGFDELCPLEESTTEIEVRCSGSDRVLMRQSLENVPAGGSDILPPAGEVSQVGSRANFMSYVFKRAANAVDYRNLSLLWHWRRLRAALKGEHQRFALISAAGQTIPRRRPTYEVYVESNRVTPHVRALLEDLQDEFSFQPSISVVLLVTKAESADLRESIESVKDQVYPHWELCIADGSNGAPEVLAVTEGLETGARVKVLSGQHGESFNALRSRATQAASGGYLAFLEQGDLLAPHALFEVASILQADREVDLIYTDEDKLGPGGKRFGGFFKPDWSPTLLLGYDYFGHLVCIRRDLFKDLGGLREEFGEASLHDLWLRASRATDRISHLPKVLYHTRADSRLGKGEPAVGSKLVEDARRAVADHCRELGLEADLVEPQVATRASTPVFQLDWPDHGPTVTIIIPTYNQHDVLQNCLDSIHRLTTYLDYEILVVDNGSDSPESQEYLQTIRRHGIRVAELPNDGEGFSFSAINNQATELCTTEYLLFLNNDTEVIEPRWLSRMMGHVQREGIGAVGARLLYPNGTIQHAGVLLSQKNGLSPGHAFLVHPASLVSYYYLAEVARECIAVTGACMLTSAETFRELGGFLTDEFRVSLQDIDYCMRLREAGLRSIYVAGAELLHHETLSRPREDDPVELARFKEKYRHLEDPYYNPNLSLEKSFSYIPDSTLGYAQARANRLKVVAFIHNLNHEGASTILSDLVLDLAARGSFEFVVVSFQDGPLGDRLRAAGVEVRIVALPGTDNVLKGWTKEDDYRHSLEKVEEVLDHEAADLALVAVLNNFFAVQAATRAGLPSIWLIQETYDAERMARSLPPFTLRECEDAFTKPYRVVFGSLETQILYERYNLRGNFTFVHNSVDWEIISRDLDGLDRDKARSSLGIAEGEKVILSVGTICPRKHQETIVKALGRLARERHDFSAFFVGAREEEPYLQTVQNLVRRYDLENRVHLVPETDDVWRYYLAADVFAFSSLNECFSLAILEAMAFGLPIVTTPCGGVGEQVRVGVNAFTYRFEDHYDLAEKLARLIDDDGLRQEMGRNSFNMHKYMQSVEEMHTRYEKLLYGAWEVGTREGA
jgi:glycosyltransferase involved in cell wall biosynthesis/predicted  nucleic acid-binding Zn-ribbon protein